MAVVDLPEAAAQASSLHCPLCHAALAPRSDDALQKPTQWPYPPGLDPECLPSYVALPWKGYWEEEHPRVQLAWMVDTAELCVRWAVALALAEVRHAHAAGLSPDVAFRIREHLERPTLGRWLAVLQALCDAKPKDPVLVPDVFRVALDFVGRQFPAGGMAETSLLVLRNEVAHAGGLSSTRARELLQSHRERFEGLVRAVAELTRDIDVLAVSDGGTVRLLGTKPERLDRPDALPAEARGPFLVGEKVTLPLWPLATFGPVRMVGGNGAMVEQGGGAAPLIYFRSDRNSLDYTPLGRDEAHSEDLDVEAFRSLFRLDEARTQRKGDLVDGFLPGDFLAEARVGAEDLVGRKQELQSIKDWLKGRDGRTEGAARVGWISGGPGVGKSMLVARVAADLSNAPADRQGLFFHRFRAGDGRNSRLSFLRLLQAALWQWEPLRAVTEAPSEEAVEGRRLEEDVKSRLAKIIDLPAPKLKSPRPRFLVLADGLDELAPLDPRFPDLVKELAHPGTVWMLAGRPEQGLTAAFDAQGCEAVFGPAGLPLMSRGDIREMLEEGLGLGRHALLKRDNEEPGGAIENPFIDRVVERARGLPLYVHLLLEDLRRGLYTVRDEDKLPTGLDAYYDQILGRIGLSTVRHDLSALVCYLANAAEPLDADALGVLIAGGLKTAQDLAYRRRVNDALRAGRSLLRLVPTNDGGDGWTLYHQSFREYVGGRPPEGDKPALPPAPALADLVLEARYRLAQAVDWWRELPHGNLRNHLFRRGVQYALKWGGEKGLQVAQQLLSDFASLMARSGALPAAEIIGLEADYLSVLMRLSEPARDEFRQWEAFVRERSNLLRRGTRWWPTQRILLQLAVEHADDSPVTRQAEAWLAAGHCDWLWLRNPRRAANAKPDPCLSVLDGHAKAVTGASSLPDGRILSWSDDGTLRSWTSDGTPLVTYVGHTVGIVGALMLEGGRLLSWARDRRLRIWSTEGKELAVLKGHRIAPIGADLLPDGRVVSWSNDRTLRVWSPYGELVATHKGFGGKDPDAIDELRGEIYEYESTVRGALLLDGDRVLGWFHNNSFEIWPLDGAVRRSLTGHTACVNGAVITPDGRILSWSDDATLRLWSTEGEQLSILRGHSGSVDGCHRFPDGRVLSWSSDKTLRVWSADGAPLLTLEGHLGRIRGATVSPGDHVWSWSEDRTLRHWSMHGEPLATIENQGRGFAGAVALTDGRVVSWSGDRALHLWSEDGRLVATWNGHTEPVAGALALGNDRILSWSRDGTLRIWATVGVSSPPLEGHDGPVKEAIVFEDGRTLSWSTDCTLRLWSAQGEPEALFRGHSEPKPLDGYLSYLRGVQGAIALPNRRVLSWANDETLRLWEMNGTPVAVFAGHRSGIRGIEILDDQRFLSWASDNAPRLWSADGAALAVLEGHTGSVNGVTVLSDGRILTWSEDGTLRLWSRDGAPLALVAGHAEPVKSVIELSNGGLLSWSLNEKPRLWTSRGDLVAILEGHSRMTRGATEIAGGRILTWSFDSTLVVWSESGEPLATLEGHRRCVISAEEFADGRILSCAEDNTLRLWSGRGELFVTIELYPADQEPLTTFEVHPGKIVDAHILPDSRFVSFSSDGSIGVWSSEGAPAGRWQREELPDEVLRALRRSALVRHGVVVRRPRGEVAVAGAHWLSTAISKPLAFLESGKVVVSVASGQVFPLELYCGAERVDAGEAVRIARSMGYGEEWVERRQEVTKMRQDASAR